ncbi:P-loop containing nucleoside triphosphate hydrolase protein [Cokeromyces recurvatus]|uniref:P-loop containing nucleoside triphosphate hydrolase protein n=1 Tax=Cokeromyces recurvatus TaxID=90255 RepID=UPI002220B846|nr:P-loop containing nucleoside triphosphate hydrolase protein [Cokeromyces recurvatus]KAI7899828.1 P-loop containing nucleoside triphosphate hydrolase protein [Cokeromyces recurvatus]
MNIGLQDGQKIMVEFCRNVTECTTVHVEPLTEDDWEILELHAGYIEENLLSQIRVVYVNQIICVWIHGKTLVRLTVAELDPKQEFLKLTNKAEVIVAPKVRKSTTEEVSDISNAVPQQRDLPTISLRVYPSSHPNLSVQIHPDSLLSFFDCVPERVRVTKIMPAFMTSNKNKQDDDVQLEEERDDLINMKHLFANLVLSKSIPLNHIAMGSILKLTLEIKDFDIVKVSVTSNKKTSIGSLILRRLVPLSLINSSSVIKLGLDNVQYQAKQKVKFETEATKAIQTWISEQQDEFTLSQGTKIDFIIDGKKEHFLIQLGVKKGFFGDTSNQTNAISSVVEQYTILSPKQTVSIKFGEDIQTVLVNNEEEQENQVILGGVDKVLDKIEHYTLANLSEKSIKDTLSVPGSGGVLITGSHGSGKTSIVKTILKSVKLSLIYTMEINCSEIAEERIPVFKDMLQKWFDEAAWHSPTLIFFDDLDRLIPAEVEHADSTRSRHLAELFVRTSLVACQRYPIMLIATAQQQQSIHPALIIHHIFSELKHLQPPNRDERKLIMQAIMSNGPSILRNSLSHIDLVSVASETEGFLAADIKAFIERTVHEGAIRNIKNNLKDESVEELTLIQEDFTKAREGFVPSSLRGVKLQSSGVNWSDIGGLNETRKALLETLEWPTKYAAVFSQCPLRLRSGVKGPEILNKYIGASEKSVRDLFERAQAAKPCVLFFDEFDSIAPRRGHDSTGVTDRVVNQMLTQMDGAEGLDGVYVLAATSRPDLIDPALLRPGRLDKALLCGMPTLEERLEILQALSSKMKLESTIDLREYAKKTEGFSGADLQGFLYNAHLEAIHGTIDIDSFKEAQNIDKSKIEKNDFIINHGSKKLPLTLAEKGHISQRLAMIKKGVYDQNTAKNELVTIKEHQEAIITKYYLDKSLKSTRPSITIEEAHRLSQIYNEFVTGRTGELPSGEGDKGIGKRSTLG